MNPPNCAMVNHTNQSRNANENEVTPKAPNDKNYTQLYAKVHPLKHSIHLQCAQVTATH